MTTLSGGMAGALPVPGCRVVADEAQVAAAFDRLAARVQPQVGAGTVLLGVLMGGVVALVELARRLQGQFQMDVCRVGRYGDALRGGTAEWLLAPRTDLRQRTVVLVDDIFEEGHTLALAVSQCQSMGAATVLSAVLVRKRHQRPMTPYAPDFVGLEVGDEYVFGCGMDYQGRFRHLPAIFALPREAQP